MVTDSKALATASGVEREGEAQSPDKAAGGARASTPSKRIRLDADDEKPDSELPITKGDLDEMQDTLQRDLSLAFFNAISTAHKKSEKRVDDLELKVNALDDQMGKEREEVRDIIVEVDGRFESIEESHSNLADKVQELRVAVEALERQSTTHSEELNVAKSSASRPPPIANNQNWDRKPDGTLLRLSTQSGVSKN